MTDIPKQKFQLGDEVEAVLQGKITRVEEIKTTLGGETYYTVRAEYSPMDMTVVVNESRISPLPKPEE